MHYTALFQGHPVRFTQPAKGTASCALMVDDIVSILETIGVAPAQLTGRPDGGAGQVGFGALIQWLEDIRAAGCAEVAMLQHWLLRHMPNAQVALGLPLLGYLLGPVKAPATRQVRRRAA